MSVFSQGENDNWIFGSGNYISFATGSPVVNPSLGTLYTKEGCASVSDEKGNLLFYSDGITVWNSKHQIMMNGKGLLGHPSSTSSCVIVPFPGNKGKYYLFTQEPNVFSNPRLSYNIVDMSLNMGEGMVVLKNKILLEPSDEKLAVTRHCNGSDFWIVVHKAQSNMYYTYLLNSKGLSSSPIISVVPKSKTKNIEIGYLKFSPDGRWLADARTLSVKLLINKFDVKTGKVKQYVVDSAFGNYDHSGQTFYGVAFSASGERLYATYFEKGYLFQYDLKGDSSNVLNSKFLVANSDRPLAALQLAKDNKIYGTNGYNTFTLNSIENPEKLHQFCGFVKNKIELNAMAHLGLPTYVESMEKYFSLGVSGLIKHSRYTLTTNIKGAKYLWSTGDTTESITVVNSGKYSVKVWSNDMCAILTDEVELEFEKRDFQVLGIDKVKYIFCENSKIVIPAFKSNKDSVVFKWFNSDTTIGLAAQGTGNLPAFVGKINTYTSNAKITVIPYRNGVEGNWLSFEIEIKPQAKIVSNHPNKVVCAGTEVEFNEVIVSPRNSNYQSIRISPISGQSDTTYNQLLSYRPNWSSKDYVDNYTIKILDDYCPLVSAKFQVKVVSNFNLRDTQLVLCSGNSYNELSLDGMFNSKSTYWKLLGKNTFGMTQSGINLLSKITLPKLSTSDTVVAMMLANNSVCSIDTGYLKIIGLPFPKFSSTFNSLKEVCVGDTVKLDPVVYDSSVYQLNWKCDIASVGIPQNGSNNIPYFVASPQTGDVFATIFYTLSMGQCMGDTGSNYIKIYKAPSQIHFNDQSVCFNEFVPPLELSSNNSGEYVACWFDTLKNSNSVDFDGRYLRFQNVEKLPNKTDIKLYYHVSNAHCNGKDDSFVYLLVRQPKSNFTSQIFVTEQKVELTNQSLYSNSINWMVNGRSFTDDSVLNFDFGELPKFQVVLIAKSEFCVDTSSQLVLIPLVVSNHIPNAFSPNNNQKNEVFKVYNADADSVSFSIFNKWGEKIYSTDNNTPWDGTFNDIECMQDVYVYLVKMSYSNGASKIFKGTVTLLR